MEGANESTELRRQPLAKSLYRVKQRFWPMYKIKKEANHSGFFFLLVHLYVFDEI